MLSLLIVFLNQFINLLFWYMKSSKVILITGASSGIGKISADMLAKSGNKVYGTSRKSDNVNTTIQMLKMDITDRGSIEQVVLEIINREGRIDVLVNNAGTGISGALELTSHDEAMQQLNTNFLGMHQVCQSVLPYMRREGKGMIINISSIAGMIAVPYQGFYSASKFAIEGYSEALAMEVYPFGIKVCLIEPGDMKTDFTTNRSISETTNQDVAYKEYFRRIMRIIERSEQNGSDPSLVGQTLIKLIQMRNPPFRSIIGPTAQVVFAHLRHLLPTRLRQYMIKKNYKIE